MMIEQHTTKKPEILHHTTKKNRQNIRHMRQIERLLDDNLYLREKLATYMHEHEACLQNRHMHTMLSSNSTSDINHVGINHKFYVWCELMSFD